MGVRAFYRLTRRDERQRRSRVPPGRILAQRQRGGERFHVEDDLDWGYLLGDHEMEQQFSIAKIADSLDQLGNLFPIVPDIKFTHEPEIVVVVQLSAGCELIRDTVA